MNEADLVVAVIALNGGKLVGRTRLQKVVYLLYQCGLDGDLDFDYDKFGPFSADLARATDVAKFQDRIHEKKKTGYHEVPYSEFTTSEDPPDYVGNLLAGDVRKALRRMDKYSAVDLELAATMAFLRDYGVSPGDIVPAVKKLKPRKATDLHLKRSRKLLKELGI